MLLRSPSVGSNTDSWPPLLPLWINCQLHSQKVLPNKLLLTSDWTGRELRQVPFSENWQSSMCNVGLRTLYETSENSNCAVESSRLFLLKPPFFALCTLSPESWPESSPILTWGLLLDESQFMHFPLLSVRIFHCTDIYSWFVFFVVLFLSNISLPLWFLSFTHDLDYFLLH